MPKKSVPSVREPVQVYLDRQDAALLNNLADRTGLPKTELLRRGLRQLAASELTDRGPGWSLNALPAILGDDPNYPADYAERHDEYLVQAYQKRKRVRSRSR